ncbi:MAG: hypothetical protein HYS98_06500 [Deltaproteobacteria bacterium]|nr:hypothetical protein [Deltaproteobacteria bacterium]
MKGHLVIANPLKMGVAIYLVVLISMVSDLHASSSAAQARRAYQTQVVTAVASYMMASEARSREDEGNASAYTMAAVMAGISAYMNYKNYQDIKRENRNGNGNSMLPPNLQNLFNNPNLPALNSLKNTYDKNGTLTADDYKKAGINTSGLENPGSGLMDPFVPKGVDLGNNEDKGLAQENAQASEQNYGGRSPAFSHSGGSGGSSSYDPYAMLSSMFPKKEEDLNPGFVGNIPTRYLASDEKLSIWERIAKQTKKHFR